jgi:hypothetical protein
VSLKECRVWKSANEGEMLEKMKIRTKTKSRRREPIPDPSLPLPFRNDVPILVESSLMP